MVAQITGKELKAKLDAGEEIILVEALPAKYYDTAHLPGAINIPHDRIDEVAPQMLTNKSAEIVFYCANAACQNSGIASQRLAELGYTKVRDYYEGKQDWLDAGLPIESSSTIAS